MTMQSLAERDYFTDFSVLKDPYEYFEAIRAKGPVHQLASNGVVVVTGFEEALQVLNNSQDFSSSISTQGPAVPLLFTPEGDDITAQIEAHRSQLMTGNLLVAYDDKQHANSRSIVNRLFTPSRLKANEAFIHEYADKLVKDAVAKGSCDLINEIATPFVTLVVADLLGVPADDRQKFMDVIAAGPPAGNIDTADQREQGSTLEFLGRYFVQYVMDRRANPRADILSELANATYPDGSLPDLMEIVRLATFLFAAGQDTSAKLLGNSMRYITDIPGLQQKLRADKSLIPQLIEEILRLEGSTKMTARLARKNTKIGTMDIPAGTRIMIAFAAANRDPRRWASPQELTLGRDKIKEHLAFGRGPHTCVGAPLARVEVRVILERFLEHTSNIDLSEEKHGPRGNRDLDFEPSFIIRGLSALHLKLQPK
jgi:cytochrome P450